MILRPHRANVESVALDAALSWRRHRLFCELCGADTAGCEPGRGLLAAHLAAQTGLIRAQRAARTR